MNSDSAAPASAPHWLHGRFARWLFSTDHKVIGGIWLAVGGFGFFLGGLLALIGALQTATSNADVIGQGTYASVTTMAGTLLTYGGILPLALGLALVVAPLQLGAHRIALPGLTATGAWLGVFGIAAVVFSSFSKGDAPRSSWATDPTALIQGTRPGEDVRLLGLLLIATATFLTAVALVATFRGPRAPGLTNDRLPLFAQSVGVTAVALLVLAPLAVIGDMVLLIAKKDDSGTWNWFLNHDGSIANPYGWLLSQAIVTIALIPALGAAAEIVATFHRGPLASRRLVGYALVGGAVLVALLPSAGTIDHERWASVLGFAALVPIAAAALVLLVDALKALRHKAPAPLLLVLGSLFLIVCAAVASLVLAISHNRLRGTAFEGGRRDLVWAAAVLALFGGTVYWWPKLSGRVLNVRLTRLSSVILATSALLLGIGQIVAGLDDQPLTAGVTTSNAAAGGTIAALGVLGLGVGIVLFGLAKFIARTGRRVGNDPWGADTLEWYTTSPPPPHNFDSLPPVESERPVADLRESLRRRNAL